MKPHVPGYRVTSPFTRDGDTNLWHAINEADDTRCLILLASAPLVDDRERFDTAMARYLSLGRHPGIVTVHGGGLTNDGTPFLAIDDDSTDPLTHPLSEPLPLDEALTTIIRVSSAVEHLHAINVRHLGITPAHVYRTRSGGTKLTILPLPGSPDSRRLAPEELRGEQADDRVDVYGLGVMLWELVGSADLPVTLQTILAAAVADDPEHRIPNVRELRVRLQEVQQQIGAPVTRVPAVPKPATSTPKPVGAVHALDAVTRMHARSRTGSVGVDDVTRVQSQDVWREQPPEETTKRRRVGRGMPQVGATHRPDEDTVPRYVANAIPEPTKTGQIGVVPYDPGTQRVSERMYKPRVHERRRVVALHEPERVATRVTQPALRHRLRRMTVGIITVGILVMVLSAWGFVALMT